MKSAVAGIVCLALTACSPASEQDATWPKVPTPEPVGMQTPFQRPLGWVQARYVAGMSIAVPPEAKVAYPQGIDSNIMFVAGPAYSLSFDDYGGFSSPATTRIVGRRAHRKVLEKGSCRSATYEIELPARVSYILSCEGEGPDRRCVGHPARANIGALCQGRSACAAVDTMISSIRFAPKPFSSYPQADEQWQSPEQPVCSVD